MAITYFNPTVVLDRRTCCDSNGKWGYATGAFVVVIPCVYAQTFTFQSVGLAKVFNGSKYGLINTGGAVIATIKYDLINDFVNGVAAAVLNGKPVRLNTSGQIV